MSIEKTLERIKTSGVVAIIRHGEGEGLTRTIGALLEGGVDCMEVALSVRGGLREITMQKEKWGDRVLIGAGEVLNTDMVNLAGAAQADFCSGISANPEMIRACNERDMAAIPGALTPTEVYNAWHGGASLIRLFPADVMGPDYVEELARVLKRVEFMPAGGITPETVGAFLAAGAVAVAAGRCLLGPDGPEQEDYDVVTSRAAALVKAVQQARPTIGG